MSGQASDDTRVQIKGTFSVKKRENNGLNRVANLMNEDRLRRVPIVGYVEFVRHVDTRDGDEMTVELIVVEPMIEADGSDPHGYGADVRRMIEKVRKGAGKASVADTLFTKDEERQVDGQLEALTRGDAGEQGETNASGDPVPEESGEEFMARRAEERAQATQDSGKRTAAAAARPDIAKAITGQPQTQQIVSPGYLKSVDGGGEKQGRAPRGAKVRPAADPFQTTAKDSQ